MTRAEELAKAYEESLDYYHCMNDWPSIAYRAGYEQALKDMGVVNELIDQKGVAIVDTIDNYSGHQTINTIRFVGEDEDKPKPLPCKYYHVWLKATKEEEL